MKTLFLAGFLCVAASTASAQGTVYFSNLRPVTGVNAPVTLNNWTGVIEPLDSRYVAQLYAGNDITSLQPVGALCPFRDGAAAGYFFGGPVLVPFLNPDAGGVFQVRFWEASMGPSWEAAMAQGGMAGLSAAFHLAPLGNPNGVPPSVPVDLVGLLPSAIVLIPEPATGALASIGIPLLLLVRRRQ